jgi:ribosomal protein S18 acetylase RimI-like enzyme
MQIIRATNVHLPQVRKLVRNARHQYADHGAEDLSALLANGIAVLAQEGDQDVGILCVRVEERPTTLPAWSPTRAHIRCIALLAGFSPRELVAQLMTPVTELLTDCRAAIQIISYGSERWLAQALKSAGFAIADRIQFYELASLSQLTASMTDGAYVAHLQAAGHEHLEPLAQLDSESFPPLWHFGYQDMLELLIRCRVQVAIWNDTLIGYSAVSTNSESEAQLARIAVHPQAQGRGIGRQLLMDSIQYAVSNGFDALILNTQTDNSRSQNLYQAFGFRSIGAPIPIWSISIAGQ